MRKLWREITDSSLDIMLWQGKPVQRPFNLGFLLGLFPGLWESALFSGESHGKLPTSVLGTKGQHVLANFLASVNTVCMEPLPASPFSYLPVCVEPPPPGWLPFLASFKAACFKLLSGQSPFCSYSTRCLDEIFALKTFMFWAARATPCPWRLGCGPSWLDYTVSEWSSLACSLS